MSALLEALAHAFEPTLEWLVRDGPRPLRIAVTALLLAICVGLLTLPLWW